MEKDYEKIKFIVEQEDYEKSQRFRDFIIALERQNDLDVTLEAYTKNPYLYYLENDARKKLSA